MLAEIINALILKPNAIQHTHGRLGHSRIVIAFTWLKCSAFHYDTANAIQRYKVLKFKTIAKRS